MSIVNFTVEYDLLAASTDSADEGADLDLVALVGEVVFTAQFSDDKPIQSPTYSPRPTGFKVLTFNGYMDSDGRLKSARSGTVGVRLPANDPVFELDRLVYRVDFNLTTPAGQRVRVDGGFIEAPSTDITVNLAEVLEATGSMSVADSLTAQRVNEVLTAAAPAVIDADLAVRDLELTDGGSGTLQFTLGGEPLGDAVAVPGAVWSNLTGTPAAVSGAGTRSREVLQRSRPGITRRVLAPGNLSWLDDFIRVYYDENRFFTDFDVTAYRHTGTAWYSDRENGANTNSGRGSTLTTALVAGTAVTSLAVAALPATFPNGSKVVISAQDQAGVWRSMVATLSAQASSGATSISVTSVTPDFSYPVGALVANPYQTVYKAYSVAAAGDQLIPLDRASNSFGGVLDRTGGWFFGEMARATTATTTANLSTGSAITSIPVSAATVLVSTGYAITLESGNNLQTFILSSALNVGGTTANVVSQQPNFAFPSGTTVRYGTRITKSITIAPRHTGEVKLVVGDWHGSGGSSTWALKSTYTNVYIVTRSNAQKVVDSGVGEYGMEYTRVANAAACETTPGSYYVSGSEVGVHYIAGGSPDPKRVHVLLSTSEITTLRNENGAMSVYLEGFTIIGGASGNLWAENTGMGNLDLYCKDMRFLWACGSTGLSDSLNADGVRRAFLQNCVAAFARKDGFNYASRDRLSTLRNAPKFIEVDCQSWGHGIGNPIAGFENVNNATTAHEGAQGLRIGGKYHQSSGAIIADVQTNTETWNVACDVWGSLSSVSDYNGGFDAQQAGTTMHVWGCRVWGNTQDIYQRSSTTMNVYNTEYDSSAGTLTSITSI